jgi:hypothetical protein
LVELNPNTIRFTQTTVKQQGATIPRLVGSMRANGFLVESQRLVDVVRMPDGLLATLDNARVLSAQRVGVNIQPSVFKCADPLPNYWLYIDRFIGRKRAVPVTYGDAVKKRIRIRKI